MLLITTSTAALMKYLLKLFVFHKKTTTSIGHKSSSDPGKCLTCEICALNVTKVYIYPFRQEEKKRNLRQISSSKHIILQKKLKKYFASLNELFSYNMTTLRIS